MRAWVVVLMVALLTTSAAMAAEKESKAPACPSPRTAAPTEAAQATSPAPPPEEIVAGGMVILRLRGVIAGKTPVQRSAELYERIDAIVCDRTLKPGDYRAVKKGKDWVVMAGSHLFVTITDEVAAANKVKPQQLAATWAKSLRKAIAAARPIPLPWEEKEASG